MITQIVLQDILDKIQSTTTVHGGDLNHTVYLQQIRDAILGVSGLKPGSLNEVIYLQQIRNAILGVADGQFGNLPAHVYLQEIRDAYLGRTKIQNGMLDEVFYLDEINGIVGPFDQRVQSLFGSSLIGHYLKSPLTFNGTSDELDIMSPSLSAAFNLSEWSIVFQAQIDVPTWTDGLSHFFTVLLADGLNYVAFSKHTDNTMIFLYVAGGVGRNVIISDITTGNMVTYAITCSKANDRLIGYVGGDHLTATQTTLGNPAGNIAFARIGNNPFTNQFFKGVMQNFMIFNRELTPDEVRQISVLGGARRVLSVLGDSISEYLTTTWVTQAILAYDSGNMLTPKNHAVGMQTILFDMDNQRAAAASDGANIIICELGTNDDNAGNMAILQSVVERNIDALRATNPYATIYYMNVLPRWTDATGVTSVDKSNIRNAVAAACSAKSVTSWDTSSWITAPQTSDGIHPNASGHNAIAAQIISRI